MKQAEADQPVSAIGTGVTGRTAGRGPLYDRGYEPAIAEGLLSVREAVARGNRKAYATRLEQRYGLSPEAAIGVADNRMRVREALRGRDAPAAAALSRRRAPAKIRTLRMLAFGLLAGSVVAAVIQGGNRPSARPQAFARQYGVSTPHRSAAGPQSSSPPNLAGARPSTVAIERDASDRVTRVSAGHPALVLEATCRLASPEGVCPWMELRETRPRSPGRRIGRFAAGEHGTTWTLYIRRERSSGRWFVGTGLRPVAPIPGTAAARRAS